LETDKTTAILTKNPIKQTAKKPRKKKGDVPNKVE
jgi:hypothetical protein